MASVVQHGRRRGVNTSVEADKRIQLPDVRQITIVRKGDWVRVQDELNKWDKEMEHKREAAKHREALKLQSQELVKLWPNSIAAQRQRKLEAKKIRDQIEEEKRKLMDIEEAKFREQKRKAAIEKAKIKLYYQTNRVKRLNSALLLTEVLKEREAQIELKQKIKSASKDVDKEFMEMVKTKDDDAMRKEQEKTLQKKLERQAVAEDLKKQVNEKQLIREQERLENMKDGKEIQHLQKLHQREQRMESERQANQKRNLMQAHLEHLTIREHIKMADAQKQEAEEKQRNLFLSAKQKMMDLRKEREKELVREAQQHREKILNKLTATQQEQTVNEEQRIAKAVAEREAKQAHLQLAEGERRAVMLKSIVAHREFMRQEKEKREKVAEQDNRDALQAKREADRIFSEKQQLKAKETGEDQRKMQDFNAAQMAEKRTKFQRMKEEELEFEERNAKLIAEEENNFQKYSQHVISAAIEAKRNVFPLYKAVREGIGGVSGPAFGGVRPTYLVQDHTDAQLPKYVTSVTKNVKKIHEAVDIKEAKERLGFMW
ncbi:coiled-coil domain-containing protein 173 isoform X2 [Melanotaenia boesemani]|uniref:coiled-coil domain-containing protein 173 isoform X2 n=1 Tax=Melanotaenia boesemani TaxID=1250792 RepID=UPI001C03D57F|nr:coiled-coil domain-containing protein 173 isoform X2 [Melanotaenia boesemani]